MRISDWSSDVCSSDLVFGGRHRLERQMRVAFGHARHQEHALGVDDLAAFPRNLSRRARHGAHAVRSEEHTSELQSLMRISYAVFCLKKKKPQITRTTSI